MEWYGVTGAWKLLTVGLLREVVEDLLFPLVMLARWCEELPDSYATRIVQTRARLALACLEPVRRLVCSRAAAVRPDKRRRAIRQAVLQLELPLGWGV